MSSQKGNVQRTRPQKHRNSTAFKNTKYDTSQRTKNILSVGQDGLCKRCKEKIEWKIKYKKYKPLTQPATCTRCHQKTVKKAYYTVCQPCATSLNICAKCAEKKDIVTEFAPDEQTQTAEQCEMEQEIKLLSERERRTLFRLKAQGKLTDGLTKEDGEDSEPNKGNVDSATQGIDELNCDSEDEDKASEEDGSEGEEKVDAYTLFE
ncbi:uncharacterized protein C9orf85 homolog [Babylonia areolata]|uniref:uncharacterized protein C9orf85 homolog n=1 Tax=Babylonia areolata TaxID=304850 RepID=UPI003FD1F4FE